MKSKKEKLNTDNIYFATSSVGILFLLLLTSFNIGKIFVNSTPRVRTVLAAHSDSEDIKLFWETKLSESPNYLPGLLELAQLEYMDGNIEYAKSLIQRARLISPNDERLKETLDLLNLN